MNKAAVAVCIGAYRTPPGWLRQAIQSVLAQTLPVAEILIGDDSPDDRLRAVVTAFGDARIRYVHHRRPRGVAANHAWLLGEARSEFVAILNHDDFWAPTFAAVLAAALQKHPQAVLAFCDHHVAHADGRIDVTASRLNSQRWGRDVLAAGLQRPFHALVAAQSVPLAMGALIRRSALDNVLDGGWVRTAGPAYDLWLAYRLARGHAGAVYVPQRLSAWRMHGSSLTHAAGADWLEGAALAWHAMASDPEFADHRRTLWAHAAAAWRASAKAALRQARFGAAAHDAAKALACAARWRHAGSRGGRPRRLSVARP
jgi:glycosyltransferase involved in cell wall biosynthesis